MLYKNKSLLFRYDFRCDFNNLKKWLAIQITSISFGAQKTESIFYLFIIVTPQRQCSSTILAMNGFVLSYVMTLLQIF